MANEGRKDDKEKLRYDLIPPYPLERLAEVYTIGAKKYDDRNWEKGITWGRIFGALMRHAWAFWRGQSIDPEGGQHHLASVAWCAFALMQYEQTHKEFDDRPCQPTDTLKSEHGTAPSVDAILALAKTQGFAGTARAAHSLSNPSSA